MASLSHSSEPTSRSGTTESIWRRKPPVILVADDDAADRELLRRALLQFSEECDVRMVADGVELLEYLERQIGSASGHSAPAPDLMIVDLKMPRKDGRQVLLAINGELGLMTPTVIFSGSDDASDIEACYQAGCNSYVTKPIDLQQFNRAVQLIATYWLRVSSLPG